MARVVEADRNDLPTARASCCTSGSGAISVGGLLGVTAPLAAALVHVPGHDLSLSERRAKDRDQVDTFGVAAAVRMREHPIAGRRVDASQRYGRSSSAIGMPSSCPPFVVSASLNGARITSRSEVHVGLPERHDFALAQAGVDAGREDAARALGHAIEDLRHPLRLEKEGFPARYFPSSLRG